MLRDFKSYESKLTKINYHPQYLMWNGQNYPAAQQRTNCIGNGRYCLQSKDAHLQDVAMNPYEDSYLFEIVRQFCIFQTAREKFIDYLIAFDDFCT
jgi:hypothetical protein